MEISISQSQKGKRQKGISEMVEMNSLKNLKSRFSIYLHLAYRLNLLKVAQKILTVNSCVKL